MVLPKYWRLTKTVQVILYHVMDFIGGLRDFYAGTAVNLFAGIRFPGGLLTALLLTDFSVVLVTQTLFSLIFC